MAKKNESKRYAGLTRISATFNEAELNDLKQVAQREGVSCTHLVNMAIANLLANYDRPIMERRIAHLTLTASRKGIGGGNKRKPIKKVTQRKKGVQVVVKGNKELIGQIELEV